MTPRVVILSSPSGGGKTTITNELRRTRSDVGYSVSATTRAPRSGERDGEAYYFLRRDEFARRRAAGEFLEWAEYAGEWYGTLKSEVDRVLGTGKHVVLDIDVQGAAQVRAPYPPPRSISIFILPPSGAAWTERLVGRQTESREALVRRLERAVVEIREARTWRHIVINDDLERAVAEVSAILDEDGGRPHRPDGRRIDELVKELVLHADRLRHQM